MSWRVTFKSFLEHNFQLFLYSATHRILFVLLPPSPCKCHLLQSHLFPVANQPQWHSAFPSPAPNNGVPEHSNLLRRIEWIANHWCKCCLAFLNLLLLLQKHHQQPQRNWFTADSHLPFRALVQAPPVCSPVVPTSCNAMNLTWLFIIALPGLNSTLPCLINRWALKSSPLPVIIPSSGTHSLGCAVR